MEVVEGREKGVHSKDTQEVKPIVAEERGDMGHEEKGGAED